MNQELKDIEVRPSGDLFGNIERRLSRRRLLRRVGWGGGALLVLGAVAFLAWPSAGDEAVQTVAAVPQVVLSEPEVPVAPMAEDFAAPRGAAGRPRTQAVPAPATADTLPSPAKIEPLQPSVAPAVVPLPQRIENELPAVPLPDLPTRDEEAASTPSAPCKNGPLPDSTAMPDQVWVPNVVAPHSDIDENRTFSVRASSELSDFRIRLFSRSGREVFHSTDPHFVWDATCDGALVPQGAYVYILSFRDSAGRPCSQQGTVTIVR